MAEEKCSFQKAAENTDWPYRGGKLSNYGEALNDFEKEGWLKKPLLVAWNDWNLNLRRLFKRILIVPLRHKYELFYAGDINVV